MIKIKNSNILPAKAIPDLCCRLLETKNIGCPKMTQHWKCSGIWADSGAKILVILEIGHKIEIGEGLGSPNLI